MAASAGRVNAEAHTAATDKAGQAAPGGERISAEPAARPADSPRVERSLVDLLRHPRFEILPLDGIEELFVPAGDATEPGEFQGAADLLAAMGGARTHFDRIGITGYPESHHLI